MFINIKTYTSIHVMIVSEPDIRKFNKILVTENASRKRYIKVNCTNEYKY